MKSVKAAISRMKEDRTQFLNFQHVAMWDTGFIICLAFLVAIACFRLLKLAGYSERTIRVIKKEFKSSVGVNDYMLCQCENR